jgi:hypothetical protein
MGAKQNTKQSDLDIALFVINVLWLIGNAYFIFSK